MGLGVEWVVEQDQGFAMNHSVSNHPPTTQSNSLFKIHQITYLALTSTQQVRLVEVKAHVRDGPAVGREAVTLRLFGYTGEVVQSHMPEIGPYSHVRRCGTGCVHRGQGLALVCGAVCALGVPG